MKLLIKIIVVIVALLFMLLMGMANQDPVKFRLAVFNVETNPIPSALMYFIFFGVGLITGGVLALGSGGGGKAPKGASSSDKK